MHKFFSRFASDEAGATAIEYGLIAAAMAVAIVAAWTILGDALTDMMNGLSAKLTVS